MEIFLARQPIFDTNLNVFGYELLHRSGRTGGYDYTDGDMASMQLLGNTLLTIGPDKVLNGRVGFINFTRQLLVSDLAFLLPPDSFVVEVLESVVADEEVVEACRNLRARDYRLALDDFVPNEGLAPLLDFANILKVDFRLTSPDARQRIVREYTRPGVRLLAEKVETAEEFEAARKEGFTYFQGYFFAKPVILSGIAIPSFKVNLLRLLAAVHSADFNFRHIEQLLKLEVPLCYRLLRFVNSAAFSARSRITSITQAMTMLGEEQLRKWITMAALPGLASDKPDELVETAVLRARFCEALALPAGLGHRSQDLFLLGMFSLLDAMIGRPLEDLLGELCLAGDVRDALLGKAPVSCRVNSIYQLVLASERSHWETVSQTADRLGITADLILGLFVESAAWCSGIFHARHLAEEKHAPVLAMRR
jgi:c-di-GMP-related signal transduction protein